MDYELTLFDRIEAVKTTINKYGEENFYISFSGGKDSIVLHYLIDLAIPNNNIPRIYINTGIEYNSIVKFVKKLAEKDHRIIIINSGVNIKKMLDENGYPFKSKEHSLKISEYKKGHFSKSIIMYKDNAGKQFGCPLNLLYQYNEDFKLNISNKCCYKLKKEPIRKWEKEHGNPICITGMRKEEGGQRKNISGCILTNKKTGRVVKFHPLLVVSEDFENWFIEQYKIELCELYYSPYNFKRTGCKGCPYALDLQEQLEIMELYLPNERKQCEFIWKTVYDEYRRIKYRLSNVEHFKLF